MDILERWPFVRGSGECIHLVIVAPKIYGHIREGGLCAEWPLTTDFALLLARYGVALVGIQQERAGATIQLNPGPRHIMKDTDLCFYMSITKEEHSAFILAHPNEDNEGLGLLRRGSMRLSLTKRPSVKKTSSVPPATATPPNNYSKVASMVATAGKMSGKGIRIQ